MALPIALPVELWILIGSYLFEPTYQDLGPNAGEKNQWNPVYSIDPVRLRTGFPVHVLRICRAAHDAVRPALYRGHRFLFHTPTSARRWVDTVGPRNSCEIRHVRLDLSVPNSEDEARAWTKLLQTMPNLDSLELRGLPKWGERPTPLSPVSVLSVNLSELRFLVCMNAARELDWRNHAGLPKLKKLQVYTVKQLCEEGHNTYEAPISTYGALARLESLDISEPLVDPEILEQALPLRELGWSGADFSVHYPTLEAKHVGYSDKPRALYAALSMEGRKKLRRHRR